MVLGGLVVRKGGSKKRCSGLGMLGMEAFAVHHEKSASADGISVVLIC